MRDWPGGMRSATSDAGRRPVKPRVAMMMLPQLGRHVCFPWRGVFSDRELPVLPDEMTIVAIRNTFEVVLMVGLCFPKLAGRSDFGDHLARP